MVKGPVLITGVYRSGTTLPAKILDAHSCIHVTTDTVNFFRYYLGRHEPVSKRYPEIIKDVTWRLNSRFSIPVPGEAILKSLKKRPSISLKDVYEEVMIHTFCNGSKELIWGEKSLLQWTNIPLFLQMFPGSRAIHIVRDPRDVLASYREFTIEKPYKYLDAVFTCLHSMKWASTVGKTISKNQYLLCRHEDIIEHPEKFAKTVCDFLNLNYEESMIHAECFTDNAGNPWKPNSAFHDVEQGSITSKSTGRWRSMLENFEVVFVESIIAELFETFGYHRSGVKAGTDDIIQLWGRIRKTELIQKRFQYWFDTGEGVEAYPSNPIDPKNWPKGMGPKGKDL